MRSRCDVNPPSNQTSPPTAQVSAFLLRNNYLLTALELMLESTEAGHEEDVALLTSFFSDQTRFPPEALAKFEPADGTLQQWCFFIHTHIARQPQPSTCKPWPRQGRRSCRSRAMSCKSPKKTHSALRCARHRRHGDPVCNTQRVRHSKSPGIIPTHTLHFSLQAMAASGARPPDPQVQGASEATPMEEPADVSAEYVAPLSVLPS